MLVPIGFLAYAAHNAYSTHQETAQKRVEVAAELQRLQERAASLEADIDELEDPRGIEAALRQRYEVGKDGEEVIVLVEDEDAYAVEEEFIEEENGGFWKRLLDAITF